MAPFSAFVIGLNIDHEDLWYGEDCDPKVVVQLGPGSSESLAHECAVALHGAFAIRKELPSFWVCRPMGSQVFQVVREDTLWRRGVPVENTQAIDQSVLTHLLQTYTLEK